MNSRRTFLRIFFVLASFGVISLLAMVSGPALTDIRAVDIIHLIGTGMCIGGAIVALTAYLRSRPPQ